MSTAHALFPPRHWPRRQRGVSMFVVLIILMLALILVLGGLTVTNMNESIVGNQADVQRTYGAAQALLDAAQRDIRLNGRYCGVPQAGGSSTIPMGNTSNNYYFTPAPPPAGPGTWPGAAAVCTLRYPRDMGDYVQMVHGGVPAGAAPAVGNCLNGVCISTSPTDTNFATGPTITDGATTTEKWSVGANYTQYVAPADGAATVDYGSNATAGAGAGGVTLALGDTGTTAGRGRYWVEVFPFAAMSGALGLGSNSTATTPDTTYPFVFRITTMAKGLKGGTVSILRTYYVPYPLVAPPTGAFASPPPPPSP